MGTELLVDALHMKPRTKPRGHWALELPSNPRDYREQMLQYKVLWRYGVQFYGIIDCNFKYTWHGLCSMITMSRCTPSPSSMRGRETLILSQFAFVLMPCCPSSEGRGGGGVLRVRVRDRCR